MLMQCITSEATLFGHWASEARERRNTGRILERLVDIEKKCEFSRITPEDTLTKNFGATINDKKPKTNLSRVVRTTIRSRNHRTGQLKP